MHPPQPVSSSAAPTLWDVQDPDRPRPLLSLRAVLLGGLLGAAMACTNLYLGLRTGIAVPVAMTACAVGTALHRGLARLRSKASGGGMSLAEMCLLQSVASAAGYASGTAL